MSSVLGIDVAKATLEVALQDEQGKWQTGHFANDAAGFARLLKWLRPRTHQPLHVCLEATGRYSHAVSRFMHEQGYVVSVINPARIPFYRGLTGQHNKTDKTDAKLLAQFGATHPPQPWTPTTPEQETLQELTRYLNSLKQEQTRLHNRLAAGPLTQWVQRDLQEQLTSLRQRIADLESEIERIAQRTAQHDAQIQLLTSIPGIGLITAIRFLAEVPDFRRFARAGQLAAYAGLVPKQHSSGTSVHRKATLSKAGNAHLRNAFYMPALSAARFNPVIRCFADRLAARGKAKMTIIAAVMRKLLTIAYGVLKSGRPFDPNYSTQFVT